MRLTLDTIEKNILTVLRNKHGDTTVKAIADKAGIELTHCIAYLQQMMDKQLVSSADGKALVPLSRVYMNYDLFERFQS